MTAKNSSLPRNLCFLEEKIGYVFRKKEYLNEAMRHSSYANENKQYGISSNERLEFLGDSVLSVVASGFLFDFFSGHPEGDLTKIRAISSARVRLPALQGRLSSVIFSISAMDRRPPTDAIRIKSLKMRLKRSSPRIILLPEKISTRWSNS